MRSEHDDMAQAAPPAEPGHYLAVLESRLAAKSGAAGFDPALVAAVLVVVVALIQNCPAKAPAALRRRAGNRARVAAAIYRDVAGAGWAESFRLAEALFDLAEAAGDAELRGLAADCCR